LGGPGAQGVSVDARKLVASTADGIFKVKSGGEKGASQKEGLFPRIYVGAGANFYMEKG